MHEAISSILFNRLLHLFISYLINNIRNNAEYIKVFSYIHLSFNQKPNSMKKQFIILMTGILFIVSCGKNEDKEFVCGDTITDIDGNTYHTVSIGSQCWTVEDLRTSKYNDGTAIRTGLDSTAWEDDTIGAYAIYNDDIANNDIYGKLYNWYAVKTGKLAISGWHVPDSTEWGELINTLGGYEVAGGKMKSVSALWGAPNTGATNSSGFSALPGGFKSQHAFYASMGVGPTWWSSTWTSVGLANAYWLAFNIERINKVGSVHNRGYSVRLIKD